MKTVRGRHCGDGIRNAIVQHIGAKAEIAERIAQPLQTQQRHGHILRELSLLVKRLDLEDPRLVALGEASRVLGGDRLEYKPGREQNALLANVGLHMGELDLEAVLNELVEAALSDAVRAVQDHAEETRRDVDRSEKLIAVVEDLETRVKGSEADLGATRAMLDAANTELATTKEENTLLAAVVGEKRTTKTKQRVKRPRGTYATAGKD